MLNDSENSIQLKNLAFHSEIMGWYSQIYRREQNAIVKILLQPQKVFGIWFELHGH